MHVEFLVEDSSGKKLLEKIIPKVLSGTNRVTWRIHPYRGIGKLPRGLTSKADPSKRLLLDQLPRLLQGYGNTPGIDLVVVVLDSDHRDCSKFLAEVHDMVHSCKPKPTTLIRLAIEELEAWYSGDKEALMQAYPRAKQAILASYVQDSPCGTWELLADAIHPGGKAALKREGGHLAGRAKHEWAERIGGFMEPARNISPSFVKFRDGLLSHVSGRRPEPQKHS